MAAPSVPATPTPADAATGITSSSPTISWVTSGATTCLVYVGVHRPPEGTPGFPAAPWPAEYEVRAGVGDVAIDGVTWTFDLDSGGVSSGIGTLRSGCRYYWQVYAQNADGTTAGPCWSFVTAAPAPSTPAPSDTATSVSTTPTLTWAQPAGASSYDVYFGTTNPPPLVSPGQSTASYAPGVALADSTLYYWQIVAHGSFDPSIGFNVIGLGDLPTVGGWTSTGPVWSFTTGTAEEAAAVALDHSVTTVDVTNTTTATAVYSFTVPGGTLSTNRALRLTLIGDFLNNLSTTWGQLEVTVSYGGSTFLGFGPLAGSFPVSAVRRALEVHAVISASGATNAQVATGRLRIADPTGANALDYDGQFVGTGAVDSTVNQTVQVTFQWVNTASASLSARKLAVHTELV